MLNIKTTLILGCSIFVGGCMSDSIKSLHLVSRNTSSETTSSIRPNNTVYNYSEADYNAWRKAYSAYNVDRKSVV